MIKFSVSVHIVNLHLCVHTHSAIPELTLEMIKFLLEKTISPQHNSVYLPLTFWTVISQNLQIKQKLLFSTAQKPFSLLKFSWLKPRTFISASLCLIPSIPCASCHSFPSIPGREMWRGKFKELFSDETWIQTWSKSTFDLLLLIHFHWTLQNPFYKVSIKLCQKKETTDTKICRGIYELWCLRKCKILFLTVLRSLTALSD